MVNNLIHFGRLKAQATIKKYKSNYQCFLRTQDISIDFIDDSQEQKNKYQIRQADSSEDNIEKIQKSFDAVTPPKGSNSKILEPIHVIQIVPDNPSEQTKYVVLNGFHRVEAARRSRKEGVKGLDVIPAIIFDGETITEEEKFQIQVDANTASDLPKLISSCSDIVFQINKVLDGTFKKGNMSKKWHGLFDLKRHQGNKSVFEKKLEESIYEIFGHYTISSTDVRKIVKRISGDRVITRLRKWKGAKELIAEFEPWLSKTNAGYNPNLDEIMVWTGTQFDYHVFGRAINKKEVENVRKIFVIVHITNVSDKTEIDINNMRQSAISGMNTMIELPSIRNDLIDEVYFAPQKRKGIQGSTTESGFWKLSGKKPTGAFLSDSKKMSNGWKK